MRARGPVGGGAYGVRMRIDQARRIALAAQGFETGFAGPAVAAGAAPTMRGVQKVIDRLRLLQIDSVNVVTRSHYLPVLSRLGPYDTALLDRARDRPPRRLVETWAHEASLVTPELWPLLRHRGAADWVVRRVAGFEDRNPGLLGRVRAALVELPPVTARELENHLEHAQPVPSTGWGWNWSAVKEALEVLFRSGEVTSAARTRQFERRYTPAARVLGATCEIRVDRDWAMEELVRQSVTALGIGSARCIRDYFRLTAAETAPALAALLASGEVEPVRIADVPGRWYLHAGARKPRRITASALLSPFDPVVWQRERAEALFDFRYRIEIYTPRHKRVHGYYVLPFLYGDRIVARCDIKADRVAGTLVVHRTIWEPDGAGSTARTPRAEEALEENLAAMADWLGLAGYRFAPPAP